MTTSRWDKFCLLMWKNWLLQINYKKQLVIEILVPTLFCFVLVLIRIESTPTQITEPTIFSTIPLLVRLSDLNESPTVPVKKYELVYTPQNSCSKKIVTDAANWLSNEQRIKVKAIGVANSSALEIYMERNRAFAGIHFANQHELNGEQIDCPKRLSYSLRFPSELKVRGDQIFAFKNWPTKFLYYINMAKPRDTTFPYPRNPSYVEEGFLPVQHAIALSFMKYAFGGSEDRNDSSSDAVKFNESIPTLTYGKFPFPPYIDDELLFFLHLVLSFVIVLSLVYPSAQIVKSITVEKEKQLKEVMKIMGLPNWLHWTAWFVNSYLKYFIIMVLIVIIVKVNWYTEFGVAVFTQSSAGALLFFMCIYAVSAITSCFMFATFFSKASTAAATFGVIWFALYMPYSIMALRYDDMSLAIKLLQCLLCNSAMGYGLLLVTKFEQAGEGLQWHNLFRPVNDDDNLSVGSIMLMMTIGSAINMLITLYVEQIMPGNYGVPQKWYFPFTQSFWCGGVVRNGKTVEDIALNGADDVRGNSNAFEEEPKNKRIGLKIKGLCKDFDGRTAVKNLTMNMYEDEITVLLGHNGAGKTTTMSMLTGMIPPSSGTAVINGFDIRTNMKDARTSLGFCPQHNILFDELTVREHIIFFSRLKGIRKENVEAEVQKYANILELIPKINTQSKKLSGGMKRKLSIGAALCGGSKVVLCDEPTSGMDPSARRALWNLLQSERKNRTILLSTHFMDEADVLGDRVAIMSNGELKANGSSFFLKKRFGAGYHLICVKEENCSSLKVTNLLRKYIPEILMESEIGNELSYELPDRYSSVFEKLLSELEEKSEELYLSGFGISSTTLAEVFMLVGVDDRENRYNGSQSVVDSSANDMESLTTDAQFTANSINLLRGHKLWLSQWKSMLLKKYLYNKRNWPTFMFQIMMAIFFVVITLSVSVMEDPVRPLRPLRISFDTYSQTVTLIEIQNGSSEYLQTVGSQYESYCNEFGSAHRSQRIETNFIDFVLDYSKQHLARVNSQYLVGITVASDRITAWVNGQLLHTLPLSFNAVHNALLRAVTKSSAYSIEVVNFPLPFTTTSKLNSIMQHKNVADSLSTNLSFCFAIASTAFALFIIKERQSRAKLLQFVSGIRVLTFWLSHMLVDYLCFVVIAIVIVLTMLCFQEPGFSSFEALGQIFFILIVFGVAVLPYTYLLSFVFQVPANGFSMISVVNMFTGMILFATVRTIDLIKVNKIPSAVKYMFLFLPHYSFVKSISDTAKTNTVQMHCLNGCKYLMGNMGNFCSFDLICKFTKQCCVQSVWSWKEPGIGANVVLTLIAAVLYFAIILIIEFGIFDSIFQGIKFLILRLFYSKLLDRKDEDHEEEDVRNEKLRISAMSMDDIKNTNIVLDSVTKYYWKFRAVDRLSVAIKTSECFGLLGVNGAGKTSTFKMLTGDESISFGQAYVQGCSLKSDLGEVYQRIGYCPQFDALLDDLTGRETLKLFALLRGLPTRRINIVSEELARGFGFMKHLDKLVKVYSGGNKRKLSTAVALLGAPSVIYLDEPTSGMDPGARRQLWNKVCQIRDTGKTIVLTSHSMEECEALCTRLAIMVNGEFKCIGSTQHLKNKYSKGLVLKIKVKKGIEDSTTRDKELIQLEVCLTEHSTILTTKRSSRPEILAVDLLPANTEIDEIKEFVRSQFNDAVLREQYQELLTFYIPLSSVRWSKIFGIMETHKAQLNIEDYSISQTTLEEIFLEFAKTQHENAEK